MTQGTTKGVPIDTDGTLAANSDFLVPSQKAVKTYVDALTPTDLGLGNVDNTSDLAKPISTATQTALDLKAPLISPTFATSVTGSYLTASEMLITNGSKQIVSASVATYPSLTELSYVKGVTSAIQTQINALANGMIYKGNWDASTGTFPGASVAQTGWFYTVSVAGTVDSVVFNVGDRLIAITNNASTTTYAGNWTQLDATDAVTSVFGRTGNVVATAGDYTAAQITNTPAGSIAAVNVQAAIDELATEKANASGALTQFVGNTAWRVFYSDGSGDITELALGASGTYLKSNGASSAPSFATPTGTGDVSKVGTPVNNQLGVWTGDGTLEGTADVTYDSSTKAMTFNQILDGATFAVYTANTAENSYSYLEFSDTEAAIDTPAFSLITGASLFSLNQGGTDAIFNVSGLASTNKTFTFPNATGTIALTSDLSSYVAKSLYDANTILYATSDNTPVALTVGASTFVGRKAAGDISAMSATEATALLNNMVGDSGAGGTKGLVPAPAAGDSGKYLKGDGTWASPAGSGDVTAASAFGTDNVIIKSDGTGKGVQSTGITIADTTNNMSGLQKLTVGVASTATGAIDFVGTTSGTVTVKTADAAGTWTLTLPTNDGDANQVLTTNGSGVTSWATPSAPALKGCRLTKSAGQSFTGTTLTVLTWDTEKFDTDSMHSTVTNTERITFNTAGYYMVSFNFNSDTNAIAYSGVRLNGSTYIHAVGIGNSGANTANGTTGSFPYYFSASDYIELFGSFGATVTSKAGESGCMFSAVLLTTS